MLRQTLLVLVLAVMAGAAGLAAGRWWFAPTIDPSLNAELNASSPKTVELPDMTGQMQSLTQFKGQPVVLNFWATWCPPCIRELPLLDDWHARRDADGLAVVAIALEPDANLVAEFINSRGLSLPVWIAEPGIGDLSSQFGNRRNVLPFSVLLSAEGDVLERHAGELSPGKLAEWRETARAN